MTRIAGARPPAARLLPGLILAALLVAVTSCTSQPTPDPCVKITADFKAVAKETIQQTDELKAMIDNGTVTLVRGSNSGPIFARTADLGEHQAFMIEQSSAREKFKVAAHIVIDNPTCFSARNVAWAETTLDEITTFEAQLR